MNEVAWRQTPRAGESRLELQPSAEAGEIAAVERRLGITFPTELSELYEVADGIYDRSGEWFVMWRLGDPDLKRPAATVCPRVLRLGASGSSARPADPNPAPL